ncbi:hypothetical protein NESM_000723900 [Novymonas esmeraldas]|uniref:Uncharacterized protein n=1 Tax=Novymonas esmeraldas TaxID=1808958 RepID=A0AAW0EWC6_9TRYP
MSVRRQAVLLLRDVVVVRRGAASLGSSAPASAAASALHDAGGAGARDDGSAHDVALPHVTRRTPLPESAPRVGYATSGFDVVEQLRTAGPGVALGRVQVSLTVYVLAASVVLLYVVYYATTYTYVLTTDPSPHRHSLFTQFPCDVAVVENKLTHKRHTVTVVPEPAAETPVGKPDARDGGGEAVHVVRTSPAVVVRRLHVNALLHRVFLYVQKTESLVMVDAQAEMAPRRFMDGACSTGAAARTPVAFLRRDQHMRDLNVDCTASGDRSASQPPSGGRSWWRRWWGRIEGTHVTQAASPGPDLAARAPTQILLESSVRLRTTVNGYQQGHINTYEQCLHHTAQEKITERYRAYVIARGMLRNRGLRKVYAEELMRNGLITGDGVTLTELVPDLQQFADEVFAAVTAKLGDDVILYTHTAKMV